MFRANTEFQEKPRQIIGLVFVCCCLGFMAYKHQSEDPKENIRASMTAVSLMFLAYCFANVRDDGILIRPHPGFWRLVHGCGVLYLLGLSALLVLNAKVSSNILSIWFHGIGKTEEVVPIVVEERAPLDCSISFSTVYTQVTSIWFTAHVVGWWGKMCMIRDWQMCWVLSISFELVEASLQFLIPSFQECYWDSILIDMFGANLIGMLVGRATLAFLNSRKYEWAPVTNHRRRLTRAFYQFTPFTWSKYRWGVFTSFERFVQNLCLVIVEIVMELNSFFLFTVLHIPANSWFNIGRLWFTCALAVAAVAEYYVYVSDPSANRLGQNTVLLSTIMVVEVLLWVKFLPDSMRGNSPPAEVYIPWLCFLALFSLWTLLFFGRPGERTRIERGGMDVLFFVSFVPLLYLTRQWAW